MKKILILVLALVAFREICLAQSYIIVSPTAVVPMTSTTIGRFEKFELGISLSHQFPNPFDPEEIEVYAIFTNLTTGTEERINGFWYQDFDMDESSPDPTRCISNPACCYNAGGVNDPNFLTAIPTDLNWRIRFSPDETGTWEYVVYVNNVGHLTNSNPYTFDCAESDNKGNISVGNNKTHFVYKNQGKNKDEEESFIPLGVNTMDNPSMSTIFNRGNYNYVINIIEKISSVGGNTIRLFMTYNEFGIEWNEDGLGNYTSRQYQAYTLDKIFELAEKKGMKIQLILLSNYEFETEYGNEWPLNPYKSLLPNQASQYEFFSNQSCINYIKKRFRYIVSRWGYSTSVLAYEFWNEVALLHGANIWNNNYGQIVDDWHTEMTDYIKTMDKRHMFTTSSGSPSFFNFGNTSMDFLQEHYYSSDKNFGFNTSVCAQHSISTYKKPFIMGETGQKCEIYTIAYTRPEFPLAVGQQPHEDLFFHNGLWSSLFNGSAGPDLYWTTGGGLFGCNGGSYKMFEPVSIFLKDENFFTKDLRFITNNPTGPAGEKDHPDYDYGNNSIPVSAFYPPSNQYPMGNYPPNPLSEFIHNDIETSNDDLIDVFAAKTTDGDSKIYGWVHNNENYWYKTRHASGANNCFGDESDNQIWSNNANITSPDLVPTLTRQTMTFKGLDCDGAYRVEYYSTWPQYDINGDANLDQGGTVSPFTQSWAYARCGTLEVIIPTLTPLASLATAPYAPDYAFKITKYQDSWSHNLVDGGLTSLSRISVNYSDKLYYSDYNGAIRTARFDNNTNTYQLQLISPANPTQNDKAYGPLCANGANQVFYKGYDGRLQCYYLTNNGTYDHVWMTDWSNTSQNVGNYIKMGPSTCYYQGADAKMHRYFFNSNTGLWEHSILPYSGNINELVAGAIAMNTIATQVYYRGADGRLQCFYRDNSNNWIHVWMTNWANTSQNVAGDIQCVPEGIFYAGTDGKLHKYYFDASQGIWVHIYVLDQNNQQIDIPANTQISIKGNADLIYFKGANGHMQQLYNKQGNKYIHDEILCETDLEDGFKNNGNIAVVDNGEIYYVGTDNFLHMYAYDVGCNPRSDKNGKKMGKEGGSKNTTFEDVSGKPQWEAFTDVMEVKPISIMPNPFSDKLMVNSNNPELLISVTIVDVFGRKVYTSTDAKDKFEINTNKFSPGVYIVTVYQNDLMVRKEKMVKN